MFKIGKALDAGRKRQGKENQDTLGLVHPRFFNRRPPMLVIADGMGGYNGGAIASQTVVKDMLAVYQKSSKKDPPLGVLKAGISRAHCKIRSLAANDSNLSQMGSTVVAAILWKDRLFLANIGDSRAYLIREETIRQVSWDHSVVGELLRQGLITPEEVRSHPKRNILTMSINAVRENLEIYTTELEWTPQDILLLCSDGLWAPVSESEIQDVVTRLSPQEAAEKLVEKANANSGPDNISILIARHR